MAGGREIAAEQESRDQTQIKKGRHKGKRRKAVVGVQYSADQRC
jgi:hypothetical protein